MANIKTKQSSLQKNTTSITNPNTRSNTGSSSRPVRNCGTSTEFAQDVCKLSDKEIISDVLGSHKSLVKLYGTALCETSCPKLRTLIDTQLSECAEDQFAGSCADVGADIFARGLCLPSDNKMTPEEQDRIIEIVKSCFK